MDYWSYDWLSTTFKTGIQDMGRTIIMVMRSMVQSLTIHKGMVRFHRKAYCTAISESRFQIALSQNDQEEFLNAIKLDVENGNE